MSRKLKIALAFIVVCFVLAVLAMRVLVIVAAIKILFG